MPTVNLNHANVSNGASLFTLNCAACHTITGAGDALANGAYAPSLHYATTRQIVEAVRSGPGNMPHFGPGNISDTDVRDITAYVHPDIQHPVNRGGFGLGGIGPVGEGFVGLLFGVGVLMLVCFWIGDRSERRAPDQEPTGPLPVAALDDPHLQPYARHPGRAQAVAAVSMILGILGCIGFGIAYWISDQTQWEAVTLGVGMLGLGFGLTAWGKYLMARGPFVEERHRAHLQRGRDQRHDRGDHRAGRHRDPAAQAPGGVCSPSVRWPSVWSSPSP